jgi:hypothetical protein
MFDFVLVEDFCNLTGANGTATFTNSEAKTFFHGDRDRSVHRDGDVITRHYHVYTFGQVKSHQSRRWYGSRTEDGS